MVATRRSKLVEPLVRRLVRGAVGGVAAGLVFAAVTMWFADSTGGKAEMPLRMISTIVQGDQAMAAGTTSPALGAVVHLALSALFGILFALAVPRFRTNGDGGACRDRLRPAAVRAQLPGADAAGVHHLPHGQPTL